jgi:hypothetical protein
LPIYGTKTIAVREGTLELHGQHTGYTWTRLESTANAGVTQITLENPVSWKIGDEIVVATTGHRHTQSQNERHTIANVTNGGKTLTLEAPLKYKHLGETLSVGGKHTLETRAEVGLLTRNVVVRGSTHAEWTEKIEACQEGFNTGDFLPYDYDISFSLFVIHPWNVHIFSGAAYTCSTGFQPCGPTHWHHAQKVN